jgi:hypothetical protein
MSCLTAGAGEIRRKFMRCRYRHHETYEEEVRCRVCGGEVVCAPFEHACRKCDAHAFRRCESCGASRLYCSC